MFLKSRVFFQGILKPIILFLLLGLAACSGISALSTSAANQPSDDAGDTSSPPTPSDLPSPSESSGVFSAANINVLNLPTSASSPYINSTSGPIVLAGQWPTGSTGSPNPEVDPGVVSMALALQGDVNLLCKYAENNDDVWRLHLQGYLVYKTKMSAKTDWDHLWDNFSFSFYNLKNNNHWEIRTSTEERIMGYIDVTVDVPKTTGLLIYKVDFNHLHEQIPDAIWDPSTMPIPKTQCPPGFTSDSSCLLFADLNFANGTYDYDLEKQEKKAIQCPTLGAETR